MAHRRPFLDQLGAVQWYWFVVEHGPQGLRHGHTEIGRDAVWWLNIMTLANKSEVELFQ